MTTSIDMTSRERVAAILEDLNSGDVSPQHVRTYLMTVTGLQATFAQEYRVADLAFKHILWLERQKHKSAADSRMAAETSPQYAAMREAKDWDDLCTKAYQACKVFLSSLDTEMRLAR
jgi:hypothetical protein